MKTAKYRLKKVTHLDGSVGFIIQKKCLFWWIDKYFQKCDAIYENIERIFGDKNEYLSEIKKKDIALDAIRWIREFKDTTLILDEDTVYFAYPYFDVDENSYSSCSYTYSESYSKARDMYILEKSHDTITKTEYIYE